METNKINKKLDDIKATIETKVVQEWLSMGQATRYIGLSVSTLRRAIKTGRLRCSHKTGKILFRRRWLDDFLGG